MTIQGGRFFADLRFESSFDAELENNLLLLGMTWRPRAEISLILTTGAGLGGELEARGRVHDVSTGPFLGLSVDWLLLSAPDSPVNVSVGLATAASFLKTTERGTKGQRESLTAFDLRLSATVARTFFNLATPYASARAFGGPVLWHQDGEDVQGTDPKHVQLAVGLGIAPLDDLSLSLEWAFFGERGLFAGLSVQTP